MTRWESDFDAVVDALEDATPEQWRAPFLLRGQLAMPLDESGIVQLGRFTVSYTSELGIEILSDGREWMSTAICTLRAPPLRGISHHHLYLLHSKERRRKKND